VATLTHEIGDHPMLFPLLQIVNFQSSEFRPPEPTSEENGDHGVIASAARVAVIERFE
jgi:hypothetical protein